MNNSASPLQSMTRKENSCDDDDDGDDDDEIKWRWEEHYQDLLNTTSQSYMQLHIHAPSNLASRNLNSNAWCGLSQWWRDSKNLLMIEYVSERSQTPQKRKSECQLRATESIRQLAWMVNNRHHPVMQRHRHQVADSNILKAWEEGCTPEDWQRSILVPIWKRKWSKQIISYIKVYISLVMLERCMWRYWKSISGQ